VLKRIGMGKLGRLGLEPAKRYERARPGELIHVDVKKLGRIHGGAGKRIWGGSSHYNRTFTDQAGNRRNTVGWDYVHVAIDDATRLAYAEVLSDEKAITAIGFLSRAIAFFERHGVIAERVITDGCFFYVKAKRLRGVLQWMAMARGEGAGVLASAGGCSSRQMRRARWRLRQRSASRRLLPSACLRAR
jgi:hypothetical protein